MIRSFVNPRDVMPPHIRTDGLNFTCGAHGTELSCDPHTTSFLLLGTCTVEFEGRYITEYSTRPIKILKLLREVYSANFVSFSYVYFGTFRLLKLFHFSVVCI